METNCETCKQKFVNKYVYKRHLSSSKHLNKNIKPTTTTYTCEPCKFITTRKHDYDFHMNTRKHILTHSPSFQFECSVCSKGYKTRSGMWKHESLCKSTAMVIPNIVATEANPLTNVVDQLVKQNQELIEIVKTQKPSMINSNNKQQFNLNFFLNDQCKDAMNWTEFIQNIQVTLQDLDKNSNITDKVIDKICTELDRMGLYRRPLHCLDNKRKKTCIKDEGEWKKETDMLLSGGIQRLSNKFKTALTEWSKLHPGWDEDQELSEEYMDMVMVYMKEPSHEKCLAQLLRATPIK